jgi:hypothetical protein
VGLLSFLLLKENESTFVHLIIPVFVFFWFETGSCSVAQADRKFAL